MRVLGALLAGGRASRFGADKALALHRGRPLIGHVADALDAQCDAVVVCGRTWGGLMSIPDVPGPGLGPMAGLCAALHHATQTAHTMVLCAPCDIPGLPRDAIDRLHSGPAVADGQWLIGLWPAALAATLEAALRQYGALSARQWVELAGARAAPFPALANINRPEDLRQIGPN